MPRLYVLFMFFLLAVTVMANNKLSETPTKLNNKEVQQAAISVSEAPAGTINSAPEMLHIIKVRGQVYLVITFSIVIIFIIAVIYFTKYRSARQKYHTAIQEYTRSLNYYKNLSGELKKELKGAESELDEARQTADHAEKLKAAFMANMSHEIRTPLTAIIGFSDLMHRSFNNEQKRKFYMGMISRNSKSLLSLIDDILDLSKLEIGEFTFKKTFFKVETMLEELFVALLQEKKNKDKKEVNIFLNSHGSTKETEIFSDSARIQQVLWKLLENALKFTQAGFVSFGCEIINKFVRFYIKDTGVGIEKQHQEYIFERFRQIDDSVKRPYGGTGLGLYFCKRMVEQMGGKIWVESLAGKGSTFFVAVPIELKEQITEQKELSPADLEDLYYCRNIIIAEDNEYQFQYLKELLKSTHAIIHWAKNGKEVLDLISELKNVDLIIMDIRMPYMDGVETTRKIRENKLDIPILVQTAYSSAHNELTYLEMGCNDFISKPIDKNEFLEKITKFIQE